MSDAKREDCPNRTWPEGPICTARTSRWSNRDGRHEALRQPIDDEQHVVECELLVDPHVLLVRADLAGVEPANRGRLCHSLSQQLESGPRLRRPRPAAAFSVETGEDESEDQLVQLL